jgi:hypothetical protein
VEVFLAATFRDVREDFLERLGAFSNHQKLCH